MNLDWIRGEAVPDNPNPDAEYLGYDGSRYYIVTWSPIWGWMNAEGEPGVAPAMALLPTSNPAALGAMGVATA